MHSLLGANMKFYLIIVAFYKADDEPAKTLPINNSHLVKKSNRFIGLTISLRRVVLGVFVCVCAHLYRIGQGYSVTVLQALQNVVITSLRNIIEQLFVIVLCY